MNTVNYLDNLHDMWMYGLLLIFFTLMTIPTIWITATMPFQPGESNFILVWISEITLIFLNISCWRQHFEYKRELNESK